MVFAVRETEEPAADRAPGTGRAPAGQRRRRGTARVGGALAARSPGPGPRPGRVPRQSAGSPGAAAGPDGDGAGLRGRRGERSGALVNRLEQRFVRRLRLLPRQARQLLLAAAAEPVGDVTVLWRAAEQLGIGTDAATAAEAAGLIELDDRVRFRHPLVRSAVYRSATPAERREVHPALAEVTDPDIDPDRRAWHRARAAVATDEAVAAELERAADRARSSGGLASAAAFLEAAAALTPDRARRARRSLDAAQAKATAGAFEEALSLLAAAQAGPLDEAGRARIDLLQRPDRRQLDLLGTRPSRCCWPPRAGSSRSTGSSPGRPTWRRCPPLCPPGGWPRDLPRPCARWRRRRARRPRRSSQQDRSAARRGWPCCTPTGTRHRHRCCTARCRRSAAKTSRWTRRSTAPGSRRSAAADLWDDVHWDAAEPATSRRHPQGGCPQPASRRAHQPRHLRDPQREPGRRRVPARGAAAGWPR